MQGKTQRLYTTYNLKAKAEKTMNEMNPSKISQVQIKNLFMNKLTGG
jgi:hypothetical protein